MKRVKNLSTVPSVRIPTPASALLLIPVFLAGCTSDPSKTKLAQEQDDYVYALMERYRQEAEIEQQGLEQAKESSAATKANLPDAVPVSKADPLLAPTSLQDLVPQQKLGLQDLWARSLEHSPQIRVFADLPLIRQTAILEGQGLFDPTLFVEGWYNDRDDPVGSTLTTGGPDRFLEEDSRVEAGIEKKFTPGTEVYFKQEFNDLENNSQYTVPNPQSGSRMVLGAVQPLLSGGGVHYNRSIIEIAKLDTAVAQQEFQRQIESHLLEISRTYWSLVMSRGIVVAKRKAVDEAEAIVAELESRGDFDAKRTQILRAKAFAAERRAALIRSETAVKNSTERIKSLVNDPKLSASGAFELVPIEAPVVAATQADIASATRLALENRPEIQQGYLQLKSAVIRREISINERMPSLNAFAEAYLAGLNEDDWQGAWDDQFDDGPGYMLGLRFEIPIGNNEAQAVNQRRRLELRQLGYQFQTTLETVLLDVKIAVREVDASYRELVAKHESMVAAREDLENLQKRKNAKILGGEAEAVTHLTLLLDAQERQLEAEQKFLRAVSTYNVARVTLLRAQGTLLREETISVEKELEETPEGQHRDWMEDKKMPVLKPAIGAEAETAAEGR